MLENSKEKYIKSVKNNLREFLKTQEYYFDETGSIDDKGASEAKVKPNTLANLCRKVENTVRNKEENPYWPEKPESKFKKLLTDNEHIDLFFIIKICESFNFPVEKVLSSEKITFLKAEEIMAEVEKETRIKQKPFAPLSKLTHKSYFGDFYGYTFDHNPNEDDKIIKFQLSIFEDENFVPKAEYTFYNQNQEKQVFVGTPYYISELKTICIEMSANNNRRYQYLYFNGAPYNSKKLTYKNGTCVRTSTASRNHEPDVKSFIITGCELSNRVLETIIPGLLKMTENNFYILSSHLEKLEQENANIKYFREKYNSDFQLIDNCVFLVKERKIIENTKYENKSERIFAFECLTTIKAFALAPNRIMYRNTEADYNFFKQLEQELNDIMSY